MRTKHTAPHLADPGNATLFLPPLPTYEPNALVDDPYMQRWSIGAAPLASPSKDAAADC
jgi:hypothetical protein